MIFLRTVITPVSFIFYAICRMPVTTTSLDSNAVESIRGDAAIFFNNKSSPNRKFNDSASYLRYRKAQIFSLSTSNAKTVQPYSPITQLQNYQATLPPLNLTATLVSGLTYLISWNPPSNVPTTYTVSLSGIKYDSTNLLSMIITLPTSANYIITVTTTGGGTTRVSI